MKRSRTRLALLLAAAVLFSACAESIAPAGSPSTVTVRAYVDQDGSGGFNAGDVALPSAALVLESTEDGWTAQATTGADGVATFQDVPPGSYRVRFSGTAPQGAVLASASTPTIATPYRGGNVNAEFRFVFNPGQISGVLYRDNNNNNQFDPTVDTPAPGIPVRLFRGTSASGDTVAVTTTSATGAYSFPTLRPGTYTLSFSPLPTMTITGGNTATVEVGAGVTTAANTRFTGQLVVPIAQARQQPAGAIITVEGVVTAGVGVFSANATSNQFNVQDATGGILVLQVPIASGIALGDSVRVTGTTSLSGGEYLITGNPTVLRLAANRPVPAPRLITAAEAAASTAADPLQGTLVRVNDVRVDSVGAGAGGYNVFVTGQQGGSFIVRVSLQSIAPQSFWQVGRRYNIVGTLAQFNGAQVKVRSAADITAAGGGIQQVRQGGAGQTVTVDGIVTAGVGIFSTNATSNQFNVQDATGGILVLQVPLASGIAIGDSVRVVGTTAVSSGEFVITGSPTVTRLAPNRPVPGPRLVTGVQVATSSATDPLQGMLVRAENVRVDSVGSGATAYNVFVTAQGGSFIVRVGTAAVGIARDYWQVGSTYHVTGALSNFNGNQIKVRSAADVVLGTGGIGAVRQAGAGQTVTVTGIVTGGVGIFSTNATSNQFNVQDATGGVLVLQVPLSAGIAQGDSVTVTGTTAVSSGEFVITGNPTVMRHATGRPVPAPLMLTPAQVAASTATDGLQGRLVSVQNVRVTAVSGTATSTAYNVDVTDGAGNNFVIRVGAAATGIAQTYWQVGQTYDVTGLLANFNGAQIKVRSTADVVQR
jgi:hypothetical protein